MRESVTRHTVMIGPKLVPTDAMIFEGSKYLFNKAGVSIDEYIVINDHELETITPSKQPTHIVILGTPWLWDKCWESVKWKNTLDFIRHNNAKVMFFGIGSCLPLGKEELVKQDIKTNIDKLDDLLRFADQIVVRDDLAYDILQDTCIDIAQLPCPAFYALENQGPSYQKQKVMIWYDPTIGISKVDYYEGSHNLKLYLNEFKKEYERIQGYKVYCIEEKEIPLAESIGLPTPIIIKDFEHAKEILVSAIKIFSGRVHLCVPSYIRGTFLDLVPVDSRATVLYDVLGSDSIDLGMIKHDYLRIIQRFSN